MTGLRNKKILLLGCSGFVGRNLKLALENGGCNDIICLGQKDLDLLDRAAVKDFFYTTGKDVEIVFFLAAQYGGIKACRENAPEYLMSNSSMVINTVEASLLLDVEKFIYVSSAVIYPVDSLQPYKEEYLLNGQLEKNVEGYALAKIVGTKLCQLIGEKYGRNFFSVVPTNMYGPYDRFYDPNSNVVASLITKFHEAKKNGSGYVELYGTGRARRDLLFVEDLVDALIFLAENYHGHDLINIGSGNDITISDLANITKEIVGYDGEIVFNKNYPDGAMKKLLDISKIRQIRWEPKHNIYEGIKLTYKWFIDNMKLYEKRE